MVSAKPCAHDDDNLVGVTDGAPLQDNPPSSHSIRGSEEEVAGRPDGRSTRTTGNCLFERSLSEGAPSPRASSPATQSARLGIAAGPVQWDGVRQALQLNESDVDESYRRVL